MPIGRYKASNESSQKNEDSEKKLNSHWIPEMPRYRLEDMILCYEASRQINDVISFFQNRDMLFRTWGLAEKFKQREGLAINLYGPPGTGKTMAAHAIANELKMQIICVNYAEIESKYVGETSKNLDALFREAKESGAIIFFDEADALLSKRVTNMTSATDVSVNQTRSVLLTLLNDYCGVILFASNFIENYDAAFLRRITHHIELQLPDCRGRELLWRSYIPARMPVDINYKSIAEKYDGISGSDISNAVFAAAISAAKDHVAVVDQKYFEQAIQNIISVKRANNGNIQISTRILQPEEANAIINRRK